MTLQDYLEETGLTQTEFAILAKTTQSTVSKYLNGRLMPRRAQLRRIAALTHGKVTANDFMGSGQDPGRDPG